MDSRQNALNFLRSRKEEHLADLQGLMKIPSISNKSDNRAAMQDAAQYVAQLLSKAGIPTVKVIPTPQHPIVFGEYNSPIPSAKTVMIYGHYDVQPVDPLDQWKHDPFSPVLDGENLFARGASDMKGPVVAAIKAAQSVIQQSDAPLNIKFLIEGEEEIGSPSLKTFLAENRDLLSCDISLNTDTEMISAESPTIIYALRGLAYFELRIFGPAHDLHSGVYGGIIHNPAQALCELIARMHDAQGRIQLPGFYDRVRPLGSAERQNLARLPIDDNYYRAHTGAPALWGEPEFSPVERIGARPTLEIHGLLSGYTGEGGKTVIPSWAMAKISTRLVPDQDPEEVHQQFVQFLQKNAPPTIRWELIAMRGGPAIQTETNLPAVQALKRALQAVWGVEPVFKREGGGIPVVAQIKNILGIDSVLTGFGLPDDNIHAPNEKVHLPTWYRGMEAVVHFLYNFAGSIGDTAS